MQICYLPKFERQYKKLPHNIKELARVKEEIFRQNPFDERLKTHKLSGQLDGFWSFSIDYSNRIFFDFVKADLVRFYAIGKHDIYE